MLIGSMGCHSVDGFIVHWSLILFDTSADGGKIGVVFYMVLQLMMGLLFDRSGIS